MIKLKYILFLLLTLFIYSCKKDDSSPTGESFFAKINGKNFNPDSTYATLVIDSSLGIRGISILAFRNDWILSIGRLDYNLTIQLPLNINYGDSSSILIGYEPDSSSRVTHMLTYNFIITKQDTINKKISGNFSANIANHDYSDTTFITEGKFENLHYELMTSN